MQAHIKDGAKVERNGEVREWYNRAGEDPPLMQVIEMGTHIAKLLWLDNINITVRCCDLVLVRETETRKVPDKPVTRKRKKSKKGTPHV